MLENHAGSGEADLSRLLMLASDPEGSRKIAEQLAELAERRAELREASAALEELREEIDRREKDLAAREASAADMARWLERKEQADKELTQHLNGREAAIAKREGEAFAAREEQLQAGEAKLAQLKKQIDNLMAQFRADLAAL
jgi:chromosome segregation ATPase